MLNRAERRAEKKRAARTKGRHCEAECPVCGIHSGTWPVSVIAFKDDEAEAKVIAAVEEGETEIEVEVISECEVDRVQWVHVAVAGPDDE